jgi:carboxymethylenebutenolidase
MIEEIVDIATPDGATTTFVVRPERNGPHPVVLFLMDAPGIREELRDMARRMASMGYYVLLPNLYYREGVLELADLPPLAEAERRARMFGFMEGLSIAMVIEDADALLAHADADPAAAEGPLAVVGYCMSGQHAINFAAHRADRVAAAASIHGTYLVTDRPDSPHRVALDARGELYFACAEMDPWAPLDRVALLAEALTGLTASAEVEIYPGVAHGFVFPERAAHHRPSADRHWERLSALWRRTIG